MVQDISESMGAMRSFLKLRDTRPEFEPIKEKGRVGLPCLHLEDDRILFELPANLDELK